MAILAYNHEIGSGSVSWPTWIRYETGEEGEGETETKRVMVSGRCAASRSPGSARARASRFPGLGFASL